MNAKSFEYFISVCTSGNFSTAANTLHVSRQAVAREIKRLERELHVTLFVRTNRGVELTESGRFFQSTLERLQGEFKTAIATMRSLEAGSKEVVRFGCNHAYLDAFTSHAIFEFEQNNPDVEVRLVHIPDLPQCWEQLRANKIDLAMTANMPHDMALPFYSSNEQAVYLCVSTQNPLAKRPAVRIPEDLAGLTVGVATELERRLVTGRLGHTGPTVSAPTMNIMRGMIEDNRLVLIAAERQSRDYPSARCTRIPIKNCAISTLFVMQAKPSPATERLAQRLSGSTLRRDAGNHPLPYSDNPGWPFI